MDWLKPLNPRGEASAGDNNDTQVAWLRVMQGEASTAQITVARKVFATHLADISLSLAGYHAITYNLPDGSRLRIVSNSGIHHATLWPAAVVPIPTLPHGFAVVTNWAAPKIFKRVVTVDPPAVEWKTDPIPVPQCRTDLEGENQVFRANSATTYFNHPMVLTDGASRSRWDYLKHSAPTLASANPVVPLCTQAGADYNTRVVHYGVDNIIKNSAGADIYTMTLSPAILTVDPETPVHVPAATTAAGTEVVLQHIRTALISPTFEIYRMRFANERLVRLDEANYSLVERNVTTEDFPLSVGVGGSSTTASGILMFPTGTPEPYGTPLLYMMYARVTGSGSSQWFNPGPPVTGGSGASIHAAWGFVDAPYDLEVGYSTSGSTEIRAPAPGGTGALEKLIAIPEATSVRFPAITTDLNYPATIFWRGGKNTAFIVYPESVSPSYGEPVVTKIRVDTSYDIDAAPSLIADFTWAQLALFEGSAASEMHGSYHVDRKSQKRNIGILGAVEAFTHILTAYPGGFVIVGSPAELAAWYADLDANNLRASLIAKLNTYPYPAADVGEVLENVSPVNTGSYVFKSRHVIDFDQKGQFWAAIRVEVEASGAEWRNTGTYWGDMRLYSAADYTVRIYLETRWRSSTAETLLTTATANRPPFEFPAVPKSNVMHTATGSGASPGDIVVHTVPNLSPPVACYEQLKSIATHQGVNTHLVCADVRDDITGPAATNTQSRAGIEFSTIEGGAIRPHTKYVTGQLYARTFKLSDFPDALWLLHSTKCDAKENDGLTGSDYFYMPALKTIIDTQTFHVEVRDGVHETWSDDFMPGPGQPAAAARDIKLYRV